MYCCIPKGHSIHYQPPPQTKKTENKKETTLKGLVPHAGLCCSDLPGWVFEGICGRQVPPQVVSQQDDFVQPHAAPPLLHGLHKLQLCLLRIAAEVRSAALAEAQQVKSVDGPLLGQGVQVEHPQAHTPTEAVQQHQRGGLTTCFLTKGQC